MSHLLLMARGNYSASGVSSEIWTVTHRLATVDGSVDNVGTLPDLTADQDTAEVNEADYIGNANFKLGGIGSSLFPLDYLTNEIYAAWSTFISTFDMISNKCELNRLDLYLVGSDGRVQDVDGLPGTPAHAFIDLPSGTRPKGGVSGEMLPLQCSLVVSWYTDITTRKGRGRSYMPGIAPASSPNGLISGIQQGIAADRAARFAENLQVTGAIGWNTRLAVIGGSQMVNYATATRAVVGRVIDTQRRRRNQLDEQYVSDPIS